MDYMQVGEKAAQNYRLETVNAGGHSSIPIRDNAIYQLADALVKVRDYEFPVKLTDTTRQFFAKAGAVRDDELGRAMVALAKNPDDRSAEAIVGVLRERSEEHTSELQSRVDLVCRLLLEKKKKNKKKKNAYNSRYRQD